MYLQDSLRRKTALTLAVLIIVQTLQPVVALALTSGPSQPEVQGFKPIEASNMVDIFTGDFNYNLPLFEIDGYPVNMAYNSNPHPDDEASWVGLGWTLNPGSVNREMRGMPDDFKEERILKEYDMKNDFTIGGNFGVSAEILGFRALSAKKGIFWNSKKGFGTETALSATVSLGKTNASLSLGFTNNTQSGLNITPGIGISMGMTKAIKKQDVSLGITSTTSININSRQGLKTVDFGLSLKASSIGKGGGGGSGLSGSGSHELGGFTYFPTNPMPIVNESAMFHGSVGLEFLSTHPNLMSDGYLSNQRLAFKSQTQKGYGYLYHTEGLKEAKAVLDCNREGQLMYREDMPNIPLSYGTYDNFSVAGQGLGGQFRLYRNDIGSLHSQPQSNRSVSLSAGFEIGVGSIFHGGYDASATKIDNISEPWIENNKMRDVTKFTDNDKDYEGVYFKETSEKTIGEQSFAEKTGGIYPIFTQISKQQSTISTERKVEAQANKKRVIVKEIKSNLQKTQRARRYNVFSYLTAAEKLQVGLDKKEQNYPVNTLMYGIDNCKKAEDVTRTPNHHIGEVSLTKGDGSRYVFGLPVYNNMQKEVSFSCDPTNDESGAYIDYGQPQNDKPNYHKGRDEFYESQTIPAYAHSYLLTGVLSDDYVDVTGNGITDDDLGNGVKFNYTRHNPNYQWRTPYKKHSARLMQGMKTDDKDDKASYVYGEKEIWYVHSIESRNMVAQFYVSERKDGLGVAGEHGGEGDRMTLNQLDKIKIFSKSDLLKNGDNAIPIKTVHFEYDNVNALCPNSDNSHLTNGGKLTLKKVFFTFGNNEKGKLNAYQFGYKTKPKDASDDKTFSYKPTEVDRWGFYKTHLPNFPKFIDYPYSTQDPSVSNANAGAWNLNSIKLPSGGQISVDYESDDYAYVQNKRAGQMFFIKGFADNPTADRITFDLYQKPSFPFAYTPVTVNKYLAIDVAAYHEDIKDLDVIRLADLFLEGIKDIFFKAKVQLSRDGKTNEFITGYLSYDKTHVVYDKDSKTLFVPVNVINEKNIDIHPITLAALQTLRLNLPDLAYDIRGDAMAVNQTQGLGIKLMLKQLFSFVTGAMDLIVGFNKVRVQQGWCQTVDVAFDGSKKNAWVRLNNPNYKKFGGGSRVKTIAVKDNWTKEGTSSSYLQKFSYTTKKDDKIISSGVASYEPGLGSEENSLKQPLPYNEKTLLAPDNSYYTETPIGESFYPSPVIGYSEVKVESTDGAGLSVGTGYTVSKFYTAKDFPTITDFTDILSGTIKVKPSVLVQIFKFNDVDQRAVSQGFMVETNDMHGKPKEEIIYNQKGAAISTTHYSYKTDDPDAITLHLNNQVEVVNTEGSLSSKNMGLETDIWQEMQEETSKTQARGIAANVDVFTIPGVPFPLAFAMVLPIFQNSSKGLKTAITTKHVRRMGILDKITKTVDGSTQTTENLAYDAETGDVLLTRTQNEFNDPLYNFTYPAHWAYDGMGSAYKNIGNVFKNIRFGQFGLIPEGLKTYLVPGDELMLTNANGDVLNTVFYVAERDVFDPNTGDKIRTDWRIYKPDGTQLSAAENDNATYTIKVKRSGRRNKAAMPIGSIASLKNPFVDNQLNIQQGQGDDGTHVLQGDAKEYKDTWRMYCKGETFTNCDDEFDYFKSQIINSYTTGMRGNWRGFTGFAHYNKRNVTASTAPSDIRHDGYIPTFTPYWTYDPLSKFWITNSSSKWVRNDLVHHYDQRGNEIESSDANNIVSSASYGFNGTQVVAVTANAKHQEMTYDSFEDYDFKNNCTTTNGSEMPKNLAFYRNQTGVNLDKTVAHTGNYSMSIDKATRLRLSGQLDGLFCVDPNNQTPPPTVMNRAASIGQDSAYNYNNCSDCLPKFGLLPDKRYTMSVWVASQNSLKTNERPLSIKVSIASQAEIMPVNLRPQGPVIEGWQKMEGEFTTPPAARFMYFSFSNLNADQKIYVDDVRILPFNAKMKAYAYDQRSRRLMAELDENHYATFYEYDDEGQLVRIKRETETGIQTVKEARNYLVPQPK